MERNSSDKQRLVTLDEEHSSSSDDTDDEKLRSVEVQGTEASSSSVLVDVGPGASSSHHRDYKGIPRSDKNSLTDSDSDDDDECLPSGSSKPTKDFAISNGETGQEEAPPLDSRPAMSQQQPDVEQQRTSRSIIDQRPRSRHPKDDVYESLDYEVCENILFQEEQRKRQSTPFAIRKDVMRWIIFIQIGIITALVACVINVIIEELATRKYRFLKMTVDANVPITSAPSGNLIIPYLYWIGVSIVPVAVGSAMVTFMEPIAGGSGIPQVKCYLNGVKVPRIVRIKTLTVKAIGLITSVLGGLAGGKEGPIIHCGAVIAAGISQGKSTTFVKDFKIFKAFRDDHEKRDFVLGGAAAGVSAAFGAPIGGMLFSLEEAASFWNQNLIWRTLIASVISSFTLNIVLSAYNGFTDFTFRGLFNLEQFETQPTFEYFELPIFMLLGVSGGLLGALFNSLNTRINSFRHRFIKWKWAKVMEAVFIAMLGVTIACVIIYFINDCRPLGNDPTEYPVQLFCADNEYNAAAALWFQTPEATVRSLFHDPPGSHKILTLAIFTFVFFMLACITFGLSVSLGVFIPTALVGAAWGRLVAMLLFDMFPNAKFLNPGKYALIGAAANLGGVLRMTISLSVILMETTGVDTTFFFPLILTLICAKWVGDYFNDGIYDNQIKMTNVPILPWAPLPKYMGLKASQVMSAPVVCIKIRDNAKYIYDVLKTSNHNGFPVVEDVENNERSTGRVCGIVLRSQLIVILLKSLYEEKKQFWLKDTTIQTFRDVYPRYPSIESVRMHDDKVDYTVNLTIFMNPSPVRVSMHDSVPKIFNQFRALGLRHMIVIDRENRVVGIITRKDFLYK